MSGYAVVLFTDWKGGNSVLAVPESWIVVVNNQVKCYFPKYNAPKLIEQRAPVQTSWKLYSVRKLSVKSINSYAVAVKKESKARFTSSIESDDLEDDQCGPSKKTKRVEDMPLARRLEKCG
jgi:hypothetical protein